RPIRDSRPQIRRILQTPQVQTKLQVGPANDGFEQEADRVADQVMRMTDTAAVSGTGAPPRVQWISTECQEEGTNLRRSPAVGAPGEPDVTPQVESGIRSLDGKGQSLTESTRAFFQQRLAADLS